MGRKKGFKMSEEQKEKLRQAQLRQPPKSEETRRKLSEALKGHGFSEETLKKMSERKKGKPLSETHRANISAALRRRGPISEETRAKLRISGAKSKGRKASDETRRKMSEARKGKPKKPNSPEARARQAATLRGRTQDPAVNAKRSASLKGREVTETHRANLSKALKGKYTGSASTNWRGGRSLNPYSADFTNYRKRQVKKRDKYICQACYRSVRGRRSCIHHINADKQNSAMENLMLLCTSCHNKVHATNPTDDSRILELRALVAW